MTGWRVGLGRGLSLRTRLCYLSGFLYYINTAVFAFVIPLLSIALLAFDPRILQLKNLIFFAPILIYSGVIYPMWHRVPYRLEAWSVREISAWAHIFALSDIMRGRLRGWQPSGSSKTKQDGRSRFWIGLIGWSFGSAAVWAGLSGTNEETIRKYYAGWEKKDWGLVDALLADNFTFTSAPATTPSIRAPSRRNAGIHRLIFSIDSIWSGCSEVVTRRL